MRLRPYETPDAEKIVSWIRDEKMFYRWSADTINQYPLSAKLLDQVYQEKKRQGDFWPVTAYTEEGLVGSFTVRCPEGDKSVLRLGYIIVDSTLRGCGLGKMMVRTAAAYAFDTLGAKKVTLGVFEDNQAALGCYLSAGFGKTGEMRQCVCGGEVCNVLELEMYR